MKRLIPAIFFGTIVTALIFLVMIWFLDFEDPDRSSPTISILTETVDPTTVATIFDNRYNNPDCKKAEADLSTRLIQSRSCEVDADCELAYFGCMTSVAKSMLDELYETERAFQSQCPYYVNICAPPLFEWRAACIQKKCAKLDGFVEEFERKTHRLIIEPD